MQGEKRKISEKWYVRAVNLVCCCCLLFLCIQRVSEREKKCVLYIWCVCNVMMTININRASRKGEGELVWLHEVVVHLSSETSVLKNPVSCSSNVRWCALG